MEINEVLAILMFLSFIALLGSLYVASGGIFLRVDLPPVSGAPERFIRMLWPSEF